MCYFQIKKHYTHMESTTVYLTSFLALFPQPKSNLTY